MAVRGVGLVAVCGLLSASWASGSVEADPLQQALLLVDLLKTEYARVKGENVILRKRELTRRSALDDATCGPTEPSQLLDGRRADFPHDNYLTANPGAPKESLYQNRRLDYDDAFGPHPGGVDPTSTTSTTTTAPAKSKSSTTTRSSTTRTVTSTTQGTSSSQATPATESSPLATIHTKVNSPSKNLILSEKPEGAKIRLNYKKPSTKTTTRDPVMEQVASEIMNEMKDSHTPKIKLAFYSAPLLSAKTERFTRFDNFTRGTLRVHQATSRRYPIPLPENNAFCFFHPDSALCRTFI